MNKFRGDPARLPPAPEQLEKLTGVPTLGVVPWLDHGLPDEDGAATPGRLPHRKSVAVVRYPTASNLDEFKLLEQVADVIWVDRSEEVERADLLILPGSKHVAADLSWLARTGLAEAVSSTPAPATRCWAYAAAPPTPSRNTSRSVRFCVRSESRERGRQATPLLFM